MPGAASAALCADERMATRVRVPWLGEVHVPSPEALAFGVGLALITALEIVDWPVAVAIGVGHALARSQQSEALRAFGQALEGA
jgi:hypothetical protein